MNAEKAAIGTVREKKKKRDQKSAAIAFYI